MQDKYVTFGNNVGAPVVVPVDASGEPIPDGVAPVAPSAASASSLVLAAAPALVDFIQVNSGASSGWLLLHNLTAAPSNGAVTPVLVWQVPANSTVTAGFEPPLSLSVGAVLTFSTTGPTTLTLSATAWFGGARSVTVQVNYSPTQPPDIGSFSLSTTYYLSPAIVPSPPAAAMASDRLYYQPFYMPRRVLNTIAIEVTTGSAGLCRLGIYRWNGALLVDAGTVDTTSIAIVAATMASVALPDEIVWAAALFNATPSCRMGGSGNAQWLGSSNFQAGYRGRTAVNAYGTLPTTMVAPTGSLANVPAIGLAFV